VTVICFASPQGGVGKTTLAANVANELSRGGQRVMALDLDPQNALRLHFGIPLQDGAGFTHRLGQQPDWRGCLRETRVGISLLPYGSAGMQDAIALSAAAAQTPSLLQRPVDDIMASNDICLVVDTPPGPSSLLAALLPKIDLLVTVLLVDAASVSLIPILEQGGVYGAGPAGNPCRIMDFVLNQFDPRNRLDGVIADAATRHLGDRLLGVVYRDEYAAEAIAAQKLLADYAPASKANLDIAAISLAILNRLGLPSPVAEVRRSGTWA
jgi:cellulose synthase operon protein YhjQ